MSVILSLFAGVLSMVSVAATGDRPAAPAVTEVHGMVRVAAADQDVGSSPAERAAWARRFGCDPSWLNDDLPKHRVRLPAFWIDRHPVTNREYGSFVAATGARAPWPGGSYRAGAADQPVVDVNHMEAAAYAAWAGKRLPTVEEWEVACGGAPPGLFPWGDAWPGPVNAGGRAGIPDWQKPGTDPVGTRRHGISPAGMEDFVQQVSEWTGTTRPHDGTSFVAVKGANWLQTDAVNFRTASTSWAMASFGTPWIGFRCALDGNRAPALTPVAPATTTRVSPPAAAPAAPAVTDARVHVWRLREAPPPVLTHVLDWTRRFLESGRPAGSPPGRGFLVQTDALGPWPLGLYLAESLHWKGAAALTDIRDTDPLLQPGRDAGGHDTYSLHFPEFDVTFTFMAGQDCVDLLTTVTNHSRTDGEFLTSSCFSLTSQPWFYDCEMQRTYLWTRDDGFVALRRIPRPGDFIRWITASDATPFGGAGVPGAMAVLSRDGNWVCGLSRLEGAANYRLSGNTWLNCLHAEAPIIVRAGFTRTTRQRLYLLRGGLKELAARLRADAPAQVTP